MRYFMKTHTLAEFTARVFMCTLMMMLLSARAVPAKDGGSGVSYENTGGTIITLMENENCRPGYISTGVVFSSEKEVESFAQYFYKRYYYGSTQVKVCYTTRSDMPGEYNLSVYTEKPQEAARQQRMVEKKLEEAAAGMSAKSDYDKAMEVYQWTYNQFEYDYSLKSINVYSAFESGKTVCNGYTRIFQALCARRGLECEIVYSVDHAWNRVLLDGQWRYVDITWNKNISENRWLFLREEEMGSHHKPLEV